jgi:hypothetical protein
VQLKASCGFIELVDGLEMDNKHFPSIFTHTMALYAATVEHHKQMVKDGTLKRKNI